MANKPIKKKKPGEKLNNVGPEYDSVREQNVLLEAIHSDIKAIAEGHTVLDRKLDDANSKLDEHTMRLDKVDLQITHINDTLSKVELDIVGLKTATMENSNGIKKLEQGQERLEQGQEKLEQRQERLEQGQQKLEQGQRQLEQGQQRIEQKLDIVTADHEQRITKLEAVR